MQRYESYKPSGVEWLGDIPESWDVCRNIGLFDERKEINQPDMELLSVTINRGVIRQEEITEKKDSSNEDKSKYKVVRKDDLAYNKMRMWQGAIGRSEYEGIVSPAYVILSPRDKLYSRYYHYLYRTEAFISEANRHSYGLCLDMNSLRYEDFKTIYSPVPPQTAAERIVAFLDQKTAEIDAAIAKKERLIELLQEQKKAAIRRAVSQGIRGSQQLIPHDLSYLKQVPSDWTIKRNKQLFFEKKEVVGKQASSFTLLSLTLNGIIPRDLDNPKGKFPAEFDTYKKVQPNDMVFCLFDVEETPRTVGLARHVGMITGAYTVVECFDPSLAGYLSYFYTALDDEKMLRPFYTGLRNVIQRNTFFGLQVPIPPENERQEIVEYIDSVIHDTAQLAEKAKQEVISLQEFKSTLVASAVTGRIKV